MLWSSAPPLADHVGPDSDLATIRRALARHGMRATGLTCYGRDREELTARLRPAHDLGLDLMVFDCEAPYPEFVERWLAPMLDEAERLGARIAVENHPAASRQRPRCARCGGCWRSTARSAPRSSCRAGPRCTLGCGARRGREGHSSPAERGTPHRWCPLACGRSSPGTAQLPRRRSRQGTGRRRGTRRAAGLRWPCVIRSGRGSSTTLMAQGVPRGEVDGPWRSRVVVSGTREVFGR
jgi:hypothetical protein